VLPDTEAGRRVAAYFDSFNSGDEARMRAFYREHIEPEALARRPVESRLETYRQMRSELGRVTPESTRVQGPAAMTVLAHVGTRQRVAFSFTFEPGSPHRIATIGVELEEGEEDGGPAPPAPAANESATVAAIVAYFDSLALTDRFSGAVLVTRKGRTLVERAAGLADRSAGSPNRPGTKFNLGSINKVFTKTAIAQLAEQGKLRLDQTVESWVPELPREVASRITVAQLVQHRSGLGDFFGPEFRAADMSKLRTNADFLPFFKDKPLLFEPGTSQRYSNGGYVVLGLIVERVSGEDYHDYCRRHIFGPAGMRDTDSYFKDAAVPDRAIGYTRTAPDQALRPNTALLPARGSAAGGGYSTARDLERFAHALGDRRLLSSAWSAWALGGPMPSPGARPGKDAPVTGFLGIAGGSPGVNATLEFNTDRGYCIVVLANGDPPMAERLGSTIRRWMERIPG
jgi:CubicO group peptidase (beta-lactamase class C family)